MLTSIIMSILGGGATGLFGMGLQRLFDFLHARELGKQRKEDQAFELAKRKIDVEIADKEWAGRTRIAETEAGAAKDVAESAAFAATMYREPESFVGTKPLTPGQTWVMVWLEFARGIVRPALTVYLCALTTYIWWQVRQLIDKEDLDTAEVLEIWKLVVSTILYLTTTCILWWFGTRVKGKQPLERS